MSLSVVTTVFNGANQMNLALPSILSQTYDEFEYIIVDDGSTDDTGRLLAEAQEADSRIRVLSPGRLGFSAALNYGFEVADGEFVARQDFDDISYPDRFSNQVEVLRSNPNLGLVGGQYVVNDLRRNERYVRMPPERHDEIVRSMAKEIPFAHTIVMFRKEAWAGVGGYPSSRNIVDLRMWLALAKAGWRFANVPEILGEHFVHESSFFNSQFTYLLRQKELADVQRACISELGLPRWMHVYPTARRFYAVLPSALKTRVRRSLGKSRESDLPASKP